MNLPEKKAAVFRAVLKLLRQGRPLGDLKVSEIAEAAGIGKGTVYEYFPSREELLRDAMQYSRAQGFQELYAAISGAEGFEARWKVIEITARQLLECSSVFFSQVPSMGFPQAALYDICGGPQERADTRRMIGEIMNCLTTAAVEEGLAPRMPEPEYLSMVGEGCISGFLLRCALSEGRQEEIAAALADTRKLYIAALNAENAEKKLEQCAFAYARNTRDCHKIAFVYFKGGVIQNQITIIFKGDIVEIY